MTFDVTASYLGLSGLRSPIGRRPQQLDTRGIIRRENDAETQATSMSAKKFKDELNLELLSRLLPFMMAGFVRYSTRQRKIAVSITDELEPFTSFFYWHLPKTFIYQAICNHFPHTMCGRIAHNPPSFLNTPKLSLSYRSWPSTMTRGPPLLRAKKYATRFIEFVNEGLYFISLTYELQYAINMQSN